MVISTRAMPLTGLVHPHTLQPEAVFLIGDIHGQWTALNSLLSSMRHANTGTKPRLLITLGDTIHKGPQSRRVLSSLLHGEAADRLQADDHIGLMGNHEILFARALVALEQGGEDLDWVPAWARGGGSDLLASWKKDRPGRTTDRLARWRDSFKGGLSGLARWGKAWEHDGLAAVHAGFAPGVDWRAMGPMDAYTLINGRAVKRPTHWATVRSPFLDWNEGFGGRLVLHGHTPPRALFRRRTLTHADLPRTFDASAQKGRVCLDGGAGFGIGIAGALIQDGTIRLYFSPC